MKGSTRAYFRIGLLVNQRGCSISNPITASFNFLRRNGIGIVGLATPLCRIGHSIADADERVVQSIGDDKGLGNCVLKRILQSAAHCCAIRGRSERATIPSFYRV